MFLGERSFREAKSKQLTKWNVRYKGCLLCGGIYFSGSVQAGQQNILCTFVVTYRSTLMCQIENREMWTILGIRNTYRVLAGVAGDKKRTKKILTECTKTKKLFFIRRGVGVGVEWGGGKNSVTDLQFETENGNVRFEYKGNLRFSEDLGIFDMILTVHRR